MITDGRRVRRRRGEPLAALALLLAGWTTARMMLWESPFAPAFPSATAAVTAPAAAPQLLSPRSKLAQHAIATEAAVLHRSLVARRLRSSLTQGAASSFVLPVTSPVTAWLPDEVTTTLRLTGVQGAVPLLVEPGASPPRISQGRWHLDAWAAWRSESGLPAIASGPQAPSYGGSQAGAIARFDLATGGHQPSLHLRATYAPDRPRQGDLAAGVGLRPLIGVPIRVMGEVRATSTAGHTEVRPAVLAITELAPIALPFGMTAEGYAQTGWVGGRYATAFADGQARLTRPVATIGGMHLRGGAGAWGGAQKFAERADIGPTVTLDLAHGPVAARLALDYRIQVAGNATPGNGVALTLSTGF